MISSDMVLGDYEYASWHACVYVVSVRQNFAHGTAVVDRVVTGVDGRCNIASTATSIPKGQKSRVVTGVDAILHRPLPRSFLADLTRRERWSPSATRQRIVFCLATFAGLRASEIAGLCLASLRLGERPSIAKGGKSRTVPLSSDATTRELEAWRERSDRVVVGQTGSPVDRNQVRRLFRRA